MQRQLLSVFFLLVLFFVFVFLSRSTDDALEQFSTRIVRLGPYEWHQVVGSEFTDGALFEGLGVEVQISRIFLFVLARSNPVDGIVFDVGMNAGMYTCLAATAGFTVHSFEPQPKCHRLMNFMIWKNGFGSRVHLHLAAAGLEDGLIKQNSDTCHATNTAIDASAGTRFDQIPVERISLLLVDLHAHSPVLLMKMDTEGFEINILRDLLPLLGQGRVHNLVVEVIPCVWKDVKAGVDVLIQLQKIARRTLLLSDPNPPHLGVARVDLDFNNEIPGPFYSVNDMSIFLLIDRLPVRSGCNFWFVFV